MKQIVKATVIALSCLALSSALVSGAGTPARAEPMPAGVVVAMAGDSITDGHYEVAGNPYAWWRDGYVVRSFARICGMYCGSQVVKYAHGGGCLAATDCAGPPATTWFVSEVLKGTPRPTTVILELGWNDLGRISDATFTAAVVQLRSAAFAYGVALIMGTVNPSCHTRPAWAAFEPQRNRWNRWIRDNFGADTVDFDAMLRVGDGSLNPAYAMDGCKSGTDFVHPGPLGAVRMADMLPLARIR